VRLILDLCGGTGAWSRPYERNDYEVLNVTLPIYDVLNFTPPINVYGILAAPPCNHFSTADGKKATEEELRDSMKIVAACLKIIWECEYQQHLKFWCLENPKARLRWFLGEPKVTVNYSDYGMFVKKPTDLWGMFNVPRTCPNTLRYPSFDKVMTRKAVERAITPEGFANSFYRANK